MPNILDDSFLDRAFDAHLFSTMPTNSDYLLQVAISNAICAACATGAFTCTVATASYATALVQAMIQRLVNMGYNTPTLSGTTLTITW
jgi:hypothetical protein